jgi:hypothetical protein
LNTDLRCSATASKSEHLSHNLQLRHEDKNTSFTTSKNMFDLRLIFAALLATFVTSSSVGALSAKAVSLGSRLSDGSSDRTWYPASCDYKQGSESYSAPFPKCTVFNYALRPNHIEIGWGNGVETVIDIVSKGSDDSPGEALVDGVSYSYRTIGSDHHFCVTQRDISSICVVPR